MKKIIFILIFIFISNVLTSQNITLQELTNLGSRSDWKQIDIYLTSKGWEYFDSKEYVDNNKLSKITWSYKKDRYSDKAEGWINAIVDANKVCRVVYQVSNKSSYDITASGITYLGFQSQKNEIKDNYIISNYVNPSYYLSVETSKTNDDNNYSSKTSWIFSLTLKGGELDNNNGKRKEYYENGNIKAEYILKDGVPFGQFTAYYENGNVKRISSMGFNQKLNGKILEYTEDGKMRLEGFFKDGELNGECKKYHSNEVLEEIGIFNNGKREGKFISYSEDSKKISEVVYKDDKANGEGKFYHDNGNIKKIAMIRDNKEDGKVIEYFENGIKESEYTTKNGKKIGLFKAYDEQGRTIRELNYKEYIIESKRFEYENDEKKPYLKEIGSYNSEEERDGMWYAFQLKNDIIIDTLVFANFIKNKKNGLCKHRVGNDSLVIADYDSDILSGGYTLYKVQKLYVGDQIITNGFFKTAEGSYKENFKIGKWIYYDSGFIRAPIAGETMGEGLKRLVKTSEGDYFNDKKNGKWLYYHGNNILNAEANYSDDLQDGMTKIYYRETKKYGVYEPINEIINFREGKKNGEYKFLDSTKTLLSSGNYKNDLKEGKWIEYNIVKKDSTDKGYYTYDEGEYENDKQEGEWIYYKDKNKILMTINYKDGRYNGKTTFWDENSKPQLTRYFIDGKLIEIQVYDKEGDNIIKAYDIEELSNFIRCNYTYFSELGKFSQVYLVKKDKELKPHEFINDFETKLSSNDNNLIYTSGQSVGYSKEGKLLYSGDLIQNLRESEWTFFDYPQNVKLKINYFRDKVLKEEYTFIDKNIPFSGKYIYLDKENNTKEERKIKNGLREGKTYYINQQGKTIKKESYKLGILQEQK